MTTLDLRAGGAKLYTAPIMLDGFSDLLQLTQPRKPIATDWAEEPRLDTVQTTLQPQPTRPLKIDIWLPKGIPHSDLRRIDSMREQYGRTYKVQIREIAEDSSFVSGSIYTLRGMIRQDDTPTAPSSTSLKYTPAGKLYTITTERISLATIGVIPLDGWCSALRDKTAYKVTSPEESREVVLPILLQGDTTGQLLNARDTLDALLHRETRNRLSTPYGTHCFYFSRSRVREYSIIYKPYIIYDLTFALV
jgi:hypothetical protein|nr:MAG TPA: hypothetical protein [Caudoviricetes sp.]